MRRGPALGSGRLHGLQDADRKQKGIEVRFVGRGRAPAGGAGTHHMLRILASWARASSSLRLRSTGPSSSMSSAPFTFRARGTGAAREGMHGTCRSQRLARARRGGRGSKIRHKAYAITAKLRVAAPLVP